MQLGRAVACAVLVSLLAAPLRADPAASPSEVWTPTEEARLEPHHGRSVLEMATGLTLGAAGYWILKDRNVADWDNPSALGRFDGSAWVLDNNSLGVNYLGHPLTGGLSYNFARANHHGVVVSTGYSFLTSFLWEFVLEFKEKISVNDVIVTPGAGLPIGEFFYKLGLYLDTYEGSSLAVDVARVTLGSGVALDRSLDGRPRPRRGPADNLGFTREIWHEFQLRYGVLAVATPERPSVARYHVGVSGRLATLRGYLAEGALSTAFYAAEISDLSLSFEASRHGTGLGASATTSLAGYHAQALRRAGQALVGSAFTLSSPIGWDYHRSSAHRYLQVERALTQPKPPLKHHVPNRREQYAAFHLPGLGVELRAARATFEGALGLRVMPSFGSIGAAAFYDWTAANPEQRTKHVLHRQGYFYGWGAKGSIEARLRFGPLRAAFDWAYAGYASQDGWDRHPERLSVDVPAQADVLMYRGALGVAPGDGAVAVTAEMGVRRFRSQVGGFERTARAVERGVSASVTF